MKMPQIIILALLLGAVQNVFAQAYGLVGAAAMGAYLNGALPNGIPGENGTPEPPATLSAVGAFSSLANLTPVSGLIPYTVNSPLWSDAARKRRWLAVPNDGTHDTAAEKIVYSAEDFWTFPVGSVLVKHFELGNDENNPASVRRLETRFFVRSTAGWYGVTYKWRPDHSDADLLPGGATADIDIALSDGGTRTQTWPFPSRTECMTCHNASSGRVLGPRSHQLNGDFTYPSTGRTDNQLRALNAIGLFSPALNEASIPALPKAVAVDDLSATLEDRAHSYLAANCAHCHRPGANLAVFDLRFHVPLAQQNLINAPLLYGLGIPGAKAIVPQSPEQSMIHHRASLTGVTQMPPIGKNEVDTAAVEAIAAWINTLPPVTLPGGGNHSPAALNDSVVTAYGTVVTFSVLANDLDADNDVLSIASFEHGAHGLVTANVGGTLAYTPDAGFSGTDTFSYVAKDPDGAVSNPATVSVIVSAAPGPSSTGFIDRSTLLSSVVHSGVPMGVADMNGDGLDDLVLIDDTYHLRIEFQQPNGGNFAAYAWGQVSVEPQWGVAIGDLDRNGINDFVTGGYYDGLSVFHGNGSGTAWTRQLVTTPAMFMQCVNMVDIDNDGWLDVFACHDDAESRKFRNNGSGVLIGDASLIDTTVSVDSVMNSGNYGSVWTDYDNNGMLDLYISKCRATAPEPTDLRRINTLFQNSGSGFSEVAATAGLADGSQSWATDFGDIDNDGDLDCFLGNHGADSVLFENNGDGTFTDATAGSGLAGIEITVIQVIFRDFNNDGFLDLLLSGSEQRLYAGAGDGTFTLLANPFVTTPIESCAVGDLNHDGFVDIYAGYATIYNNPHPNRPDRIFMNSGNANGFLAVNLEGVSSNINGVGARLELHDSTWGVQLREVRAGESYGITNTHTQHFGLGSGAQADQLVVKWPSGTVDTVFNPNANQFLRIREGSTQAPMIVSPGNQSSTINGSVSLQISASDPTGDELTFWAGNLPAGLSIDVSTGLIGGTVNLAAAGDYSVIVAVSDAFGTESVSFEWHVEGADTATFSGWQLVTPGAGVTPLSDNDKDSMADLLEFALGASPASGKVEGLGLRVIGGGIVEYDRPTGLADLNYKMTTSSDLLNWPEVTEIPTTVPAGVGRETVRYSSLPANAGFARLEVSLGSPAAMVKSRAVGWKKTTLRVGFQSFGVSLLEPAVYASEVVSIDSGGLNVMTSLSGITFAPGYGYYAELSDGKRLEIDEAATAGTRIFVESSTPAPLNAAGKCVVVRRHKVLGEVFGKEVFTAGANIGVADQVMFFNGSTFDTAYLFEGSLVKVWLMIAGGFADQGKRSLLPGQGILVNRVNGGGDVDVMVTGEVRSNDFWQPLRQGFQLISEGYPVPATPVSRKLLKADGFTAGSGLGDADRIHVWAGDSVLSSQTYNVYMLLDVTPSVSFWRLFNSDYSSRDNETIFQPDRSVFLNLKTGPVPEYEVPVPWGK